MPRKRYTFGVFKATHGTTANKYLIGKHQGHKSLKKRVRKPGIGRKR